MISEMESHFKECPPRTNILVVDTNITTLLNMKKTITQCNYQVMIETNGERALAFLKNCRHEINIVIWDLHMSGINGIQALKAIGSEMDMPVIIMSDDDQNETVMEAIYHGACDYVMKPVPKEKIAFIWQHIVRKKMKSRPVSIPLPVQSDLAQSSRLDQVKADSTRSGSDQDHTERNEEKSAKSTAWIEETHPFQPDLVQTDDVDQQNENYVTINQDNGEVNIEEENAAKIPRTEETQVFQTGRLQTEGLDQDNDNFKILAEDNNGEQNIEEEIASKKPRTEESQVVQTDRLQIEGLDQDNADSKILSEDNNGEGKIENKKEKRARRPPMVWTGDLHQNFLEAIERVGGIENANPRVLLKCMQDMKIEGLTRYNVASHLQKYRISLEEAQIAHYRTQEFGSSSSLLAPNNFHTALSSYLFSGQATNPMQQSLCQSGYLTKNNNQFITDPYQSCYLTSFPYLDCLREPQNQQYLSSNQHILAQQYHSFNQEQECQSSNQEHQYQSSYQQQPYQFSNQQQQYLLANQEQQYQLFNQQQPYQLSNQEQQYQLSNQQLQHQLANQELQYQSANQELQYQSANQELQYQSANQQQEYQPANQQQKYQSANQQASDSISATDVELIYPSLPYDPREYFLNGCNFNQ